MDNSVITSDLTQSDDNYTIDDIIDDEPIKDVIVPEIIKDDSLKPSAIEVKTPIKTIESKADIRIGSLVTIDESNVYYSSADAALNKQAPIQVGTLIYPGEYEVNRIAVLKANEHGHYSTIKIFDKKVSIEQLARQALNMKFAVHLKIIDGIGQVNDIGWLDTDQIKLVRNRGGIIDEYTVRRG